MSARPSAPARQLTCRPSRTLVMTGSDAERPADRGAKLAAISTLTLRLLASTRSQANSGSHGHRRKHGGRGAARHVTLVELALKRRDAGARRSRHGLQDWANLVACARAAPDAERGLVAQHHGHRLGVLGEDERLQRVLRPTSRRRPSGSAGVWAGEQALVHVFGVRSRSARQRANCSRRAGDQPGSTSAVPGRVRRPLGGEGKRWALPPDTARHPQTLAPSRGPRALGHGDSSSSTGWAAREAG
jgi:hypothetical protein